MRFLKNRNFSKRILINEEMLFSFGLIGQNMFKHRQNNFNNFLYGHNPIFNLIKLCLILITIVAIVKLLINLKR